MAKLKFNAKTAEPMEERSFTLLPEGEYIFSLVKSEIVENKKKTAYRLNFQAKVLGGEFKGNIVFIGLNWDHPNPEAQAISDREFKSICDAVDKGNEEELDDTALLHGIPFIGTVVHSAPSDEYKDEKGNTKFRYGPKAEIKKYAKADEDSLASIQANEEGSETQTESQPPWKK